jgi:hypothetical protein
MKPASRTKFLTLRRAYEGSPPTVRSTQMRGSLRTIEGRLPNDFCSAARARSPNLAKVKSATARRLPARVIPLHKNGPGRSQLAPIAERTSSFKRVTARASQKPFGLSGRGGMRSDGSSYPQKDATRAKAEVPERCIPRMTRARPSELVPIRMVLLLLVHTSIADGRFLPDCDSSHKKASALWRLPGRASGRSDP